MKRTTLVSFAVAIGYFLTVADAMFAHHGTGISYDMTKTLTMAATVTQFRYANPHCQISFDVKNEKGEVTHWTAEATDPAGLARNGWTKKRSEAALLPGTSITITVFPGKAGNPTGLVSKILNAKGEEILLPREPPRTATQ